MSPLQQLAGAFAELAQTGNDDELISALDLCLGFADKIVHDCNVDEMLAKLSDRMKRKELQFDGSTSLN